MTWQLLPTWMKLTRGHFAIGAGFWTGSIPDPRIFTVKPAVITEGFQVLLAPADRSRHLRAVDFWEHPSTSFTSLEIGTVSHFDCPPRMSLAFIDPAAVFNETAVVELLRLIPVESFGVILLGVGSVDQVGFEKFEHDLLTSAGGFQVLRHEPSDEDQVWRGNRDSRLKTTGMEMAQ